LGGVSSSEEFKNEINSFRILKDLEARMPILQTVSKTRFDKHTIAVSSIFIFENEAPKLQHIKNSQKKHEVSFEVKLKKKQQYNFTLVGSACTTRNFKDPQSESERFVIYALLNNKDDIKKDLKYYESKIAVEGPAMSHSVLEDFI